jgi:hypothetical protein
MIAANAIDVGDVADSNPRTWVGNGEATFLSVFTKIKCTSVRSWVLLTVCFVYFSVLFCVSYRRFQSSHLG